MKTIPLCISPTRLVQKALDVLSQWQNRTDSAVVHFLLVALQLCFIGICFAVYLAIVIGFIFLCLWPFLPHIK